MYIVSTLVCLKMLMGIIRKPFTNMIANVVICGFLLWLFNNFQLGISISIDPTLSATIFHLIAVFAVMGFVFWFLNSPIKRVIQKLSFPVNMLTLGLFSLVINVFIFYLFERIMDTYASPDVIVDLGNFLQTLILSLIMTVGITILKKII